MRKIVFCLVLALAVVVMAGCASREARYASSLRPAAEKINTCATLADMYTRPGSGFFMASTDEDRESALRLCLSVANEIKSDFYSPYWAGRLMQFMCDSRGACDAYSEASKRGHPAQPFTVYCNADGTLK